MPRKKITYSKKELERFTNFIIVFSDKSIDTSIIDINEANQYIAKHNRPAIVITSSEKYSNIDKISYTLVMNSTKPVFKRVDVNGNGYEKVYDVLLDRYKNGLLIADKDTITNKIAAKMASCKDCGIDFLIYRDNLLSITPEEKKRVNFLRIHKNDEFSFNPQVLELLAKDFGEANAFGISLAQYIANQQYNIFTTYINEKAELFAKNGLNENVLHNEEYSMQLAYFCYYSLNNHKIYGISEGKINAYIQALCDILKFKYTDNKINEIKKTFLPETKKQTP